ncbi:hypothetical protein GUJ93_ZPchr0006g41494 [Zizania palustris]|uniref:Uncharacterized protein n=1 Tax=Zizania palustris TaxID=103762 RepID=A0A8J5W300_ZIZPA|nr:hypothetical protein GUJ93_ZPchr0006g41494 [Zizania palustris]
MLGSGLNLVTTVIGFGMSATFIVFVCARLICGRAARTNAGEGVGAAARAMAPGPAPFDFDVEFRATNLDRTVSFLCSIALVWIAYAHYLHKIEHTRSGLEPFVVAAIPTVKYNYEAFHSKDDAQVKGSINNTDQIRGGETICSNSSSNSAERSPVQPSVWPRNLQYCTA